MDGEPIRRLDLRGDFARGGDVAHQPQGIRAAVGDDIGAVTGGAQRVLDAGEGRGVRGALVCPVDCRAEQMAEQQVTLQLGGRLAARRVEDEVRIQPQGSRASSSLAGVVGLGGAGGDHAVRTGFQRGGQQILQLARFVAAGGQARLVVALDVEGRAAEVGAQAGQRLDRRGQQGQGHTRQPVEGGERIGWCGQGQPPSDILW